MLDFAIVGDESKLKLRLLDILACPIDKTWPLRVHIFEEREIAEPKIPQVDETTKVVCRYYCGKNDIILTNESENTLTVTAQASKITYEKDCKECFSKEIVSGIIKCSKCETYYPVIDEIPMMLKVELRNEDIERKFTMKWSEKIKELL